MTEEFLRFCATHGFQADALAGKVATWDQQSDAYALTGSGEVTGLEVERYGEFGNNVIQLLHAVYLARRLGLKWVHAPSLASMFREGVYALSDGLQLVIGPRPSSLTGNALRGRYFFWWGASGSLRSMPAVDAVRIAREDLRQTLHLSEKPDAGDHSTESAAPAPTIHIHLRGGSDIFGAGAKPLGAPGKLNAGYVQPPLSFYRKILEAWFSLHANGRVVIVSMDRANPCVGALEKILGDRGCDFAWQSGTVQEDVAALYGSDAIVAGWGTFVPMIALLSKSVKTVYFFRDPQQAPRLEAGGISVVTVLDDCGRYLPRGAWTNTPQELAAMLDYPMECLSLSGGPKSVESP